MKNRGLLVGLIVLGVLGGWAYRSQMKRTAPSTDAGLEDATLLGFDINDVTAVEIVNADETSLVARKEGTWVADSAWDYPADFDRVSTELRNLSELETGQAIRGGTDMLDEFGLDDDAAEADRQPLRVTFFGTDGKTLGCLRVGDQRTGSTGGGPMGGQYVRLDDGPVLLIDGFLGSLPRDSRGWLNTQLPTVQAAQVAEVQVALPGQDAYRIEKRGAGGFSIDGLAEDEELAEDAANKLASALQFLSFTDVADPSKSDEELGFDQAGTFSLKTSEGLIYTLALGNEFDANGRYARMSVRFEKGAPPEKPAPAEAEETDEPAEAAEGEAEETGEAATNEAEAEYQRRLTEYQGQVARLEKQVQDESKRLGSWTYILPKHSCDSMQVPRTDLVKKVPPPEPETPADEAVPSDTQADTAAEPKS